MVLLNQLEDIHVLRLNATGSIEHEDTYIGVLDGTDTTHHGIEFQVFIDFVLTADTCGIYQIEIKAELIIASVDTVTGSTRNLGHDMAFLTNKGVDYAALSCIRTAHHGKAGYAFLKQVATFLG